LPQKNPWQSRIYDLEYVDLRHIVDHLRLEYDKRGLPERTYIKKGDVDTVKGVRLNCAGDITIRQRPLFEAVDVSRWLCSTESETTCDIAARIGTLLVLRKIPYDLCWRDRHLNDRIQRASNPAFAILDWRDNSTRPGCANLLLES
jgi:hypothetical protein